MVRNRNCLQGLLAAAGMLVLILDSGLALEGARDGLTLCIQTVIPSLFPFFVLSSVLLSALSEQDSILIKLLAKKLMIPQRAASLVIPGFLGGYPVGAKCVADLYESRQISKKDAQRLLAFCSNAGPSFLFGMVACCFPERKAAWLLWFIQILSALLTAAVIPGQAEQMLPQPEKGKAGKPSALISSARAMGVVCCWVILFRMLITFLSHWCLWLFPVWVQVFLTGILELTNGCCQLMLISDVRLRFILCSCMLSFGGICVLLQTASVIGELKLGSYLGGKLIQTAFSLLLSLCITNSSVIPIAVTLPLLVVILRKIQNRYGNFGFFPV